jgi:trehalose 6-phosphate phosphatase
MTMAVPAPAPGWAFFLDVDGTLLDIAAQPDAVRVDPRVLPTLTRLIKATDGAVALVSGRSVADVEHLFAPLAIAVAGQHGAEHQPHRGARLSRSPLLDGVAERLREAERRMPGLLLEDKGASLALHYRRRPDLQEYAEDQMQRAAATLGDRFELQPGSFVYEIKPSGHDKGRAIETFMREPPFAGRLPVFLGDDATDEHGFDAVNRMGGHSVKVGPGPTRARWSLPDSGSARRWLDDYARILSRTPARQDTI